MSLNNMNKYIYNITSFKNYDIINYIINNEIYLKIKIFIDNFKKSNNIFNKKDIINIDNQIYLFLNKLLNKYKNIIIFKNKFIELYINELIELNYKNIKFIIQLIYEKKLLICYNKIYIKKQTSMLYTISIKKIYLEQKIYLDNDDLILYNFLLDINDIDSINKNLININSKNKSIWNNEKLYNFKLSNILPLTISNIWNI